MRHTDTPISALAAPQPPAHIPQSPPQIEGPKSHVPLKIVDYGYISRLPPIPEIFDPHAAIAEVEYRWNQKIRTYPIAGKTLYRLMELGWISREEVSHRAAVMDLKELQQYTSRQPIYLWKPIGDRMAPTPEERDALMQQRSWYYQQQDVMRMEVEQKVKEEHDRPKQYPAPLHTYACKDYPELYQDEQGENSENAVPKKGGGKLRRTETLLLF